MIGIPCLDAAASLLPPSSCVLAATDARMGEVFYAWFDTQNHVRLSDYTVGKATAIAAPESKTPTGGIGNAFALADKPPFDGQADMPTAADYLKLARSGRYLATDAAHAELLYVRNKIALTAQEQALALEKRLFEALLKDIQTTLPQLQKAAKAAAALDVLSTLRRHRR